MRKKLTEQPFEVGETVLCAYAGVLQHDCADDKCWEATVTTINRHEDFESGWRVTAVARLPCPYGHSETPLLDSAWFRKIQK
jgi:hypothetical protein